MRTDREFRAKIKMLLDMSSRSVLKVADEAKVEKSSLYNYFSNKTSLLGDALIRVLKEVGIDVKEMINQQVLLQLDGNKVDPLIATDLAILFNRLSTYERKTLVETLISKNRTSDMLSVRGAMLRLEQYMHEDIAEKRSGVC